ncbi:MAG: DivIVA domain-containing protein, partial [Ilumatobacteraceae bacterium]
PSAVAGASFPTTRRGFDQSEVRDFLRMVSAELSRLQERERFLERELTNQQGVSLVPGDLDADRLADLLGEETARIIQAAREAGAKLRHRAEETAQRLIRDATEDSARIREEADLEAARVRQDAMADAESEIMMAKQQGRDMVDEARAYRERVLADISRRRELAREQIEDLYHGRERLIQAFERARVATDDVLSDLEDAADEPSGFVNLANSTGPVPLVVQDDPVVYDQDSDDEGDSRVIRHPSIDQPEVADAVVEETVADSPVVDTIVDEVADEATEESSVEVVVDQVVDNVVETPRSSTKSTTMTSLIWTMSTSRSSTNPSARLGPLDRRPAPTTSSPSCAERAPRWWPKMRTGKPRRRPLPRRPKNPRLRRYRWPVPSPRPWVRSARSRVGTKFSFLLS